MATKDYSFPGIYPVGDNMMQKKPGLKTSEYLKALYDKKLDRKNTPNTFYAVDENGHQIMVDINQVINIEDKVIQILDARDAPADNKQYARENKKWEEVELYKVRLLNVPVNTTDWILRTASEDYPYEYHIHDERIESTMIPEVVFSEEDSLSAIFSPICESFDGYVCIYASQIPENEIVIPVVTLQ